jgi:hypothetical protein
VAGIQLLVPARSRVGCHDDLTNYPNNASDNAEQNTGQHYPVEAAYAGKPPSHAGALPYPKHDERAGFVRVFTNGREPSIAGQLKPVRRDEKFRHIDLSPSIRVVTRPLISSREGEDGV